MALHSGFAVPCGTHTLTIYPHYFIFLPPIIQSAHFATIEIKDYYRRKESGNNPRRQPLAVFSLNSNTISLNLIPSVHPHSFRERQKLGRQQLQPFSFILSLLFLFLTPTAFLVSIILLTVVNNQGSNFRTCFSVQS